MLYESKDLQVTDKGEVYYLGKAMKMDNETRETIIEDLSNATGKARRAVVLTLRTIAKRTKAEEDMDSLRLIKHELPDAVGFRFMKRDIQRHLDGEALEDGKYISVLPSKPDTSKKPVVAHIAHYMCEKAIAAAFLVKEYSQALLDEVRDGNYDPIANTGNAWFDFIRTNDTEAFKNKVLPTAETLKATLIDAKNYLRIANGGCANLKHVVNQASQLTDPSAKSMNMFSIGLESIDLYDEDPEMMHNTTKSLGAVIHMGNALEAKVIPALNQEIDKATTLIKDCKAPYEKAMKEYGENLT